jgi:hypothetical protein
MAVRIAALLIGFSALIAGLRSLSVHPVEGALMIIAGMASLLYSADGFCKGPGVFGSSQERK